MSCPLSGSRPLGSAAVVAPWVGGGKSLGACCMGFEVPVPCEILPANRGDGTGELRVSRCVLPLGSEVGGASAWSSSVRNAVCGQASGRRESALSAGLGPDSEAAMLLSAGTSNHMVALGSEDLQHPDPAQALSVGLDFVPRGPFSVDVAAPQTGCTLAAQQQAQVAAEFRRRREVLEERLRVACAGGGGRFTESEACVVARRDVAEAYAPLQEAAENAAREVVQRCFPGAGQQGSLDGLAAEMYLLAAVPGRGSALEPLGEDARFCSLRSDMARHLCATVPSRLVEPQLQQISALCGVDAISPQGRAPEDALGEAERTLRQAARMSMDDAPFGGSETLRRWCPLLLSSAADNVASLRARFTVNPAVGRAERVQCANLTPASTCLGPGGVERIGRVSSLVEESGGVGEAENGGGEAEDGGEDVQGGGGPEDGSRVRPPQDVSARPGAASDTVNFFTDVADKSRSAKAEAIAKLQSLVPRNVFVERIDPDEIPTNASLDKADQNRGTCMLHCHARAMGPDDPTKLMNCRLFTPSNPATDCRRAVVSVVDESPVAEGVDVRERSGPAYDTIRGVLNGFVGCNVDRAGTLNGLPVGAQNVRLEPFAAPRWGDAGARYGFCYMERDQVAAGVGSEQTLRLNKMRQPSGEYMLAFATSKGRDGGRMAQRECKMLLDLQQNVCRHKFSLDLDRLPDYRRDCGGLKEQVDTGVRIPVTVPRPDGSRRTVYVPVMDYPKQSCTLSKLADACGRITNFAVGEPEGDIERNERYGVPDSNDFHCPLPTAGAARKIAGNPKADSRAGSVAGVAVGRQEYETTQWSTMDRDKLFAKEDLDAGCEATCLLYYDYMNPSETALYNDCVRRCFAEVQV
jgi:hypothetical protein